MGLGFIKWKGTVGPWRRYVLYRVPFLIAHFSRFMSSVGTNGLGAERDRQVGEVRKYG